MISDQSMDEISEHKKTQSLKAIKSFKNQVISALFEFYKLRNMIDYEGNPKGTDI